MKIFTPPTINPQEIRDALETNLHKAASKKKFADTISRFNAVEKILKAAEIYENTDEDKAKRITKLLHTFTVLAEKREKEFASKTAELTNKVNQISLKIKTASELESGMLKFAFNKLSERPDITEATDKNLREINESLELANSVLPEEDDESWED